MNKLTEGAKYARREIRLAGAACLPGFYLCYVFPLGMTVWYAFINNAFDHRFAGMKNFSWVLQNRFFLLGSGNFLYLGSLMLLGSMFFTLLLAPLLWQHPRLAKVGIAILVLPLLIPSISVVAVWKIFFDTSSMLNAVSSRLALLTLYVWRNTGVCAVLLYTELRRIPEDILDAAALDGAGRIRSYWMIQLPLSRRSLALAVTILLMFLLRIYKESYLLFGPYPGNSVYLIQHYMNHQYLKMNFQYVAAMAVLLTVLALMLYGMVYLMINKRKTI